MKILRRMYDWLIAAASGRYAMAVLFAVAFMESSFFPVPPDVMIIPMVLAARDRAWRIAGMATAACQRDRRLFRLCHRFLRL